MFGPTENLKKLGTILDEGAELSRRKHLAGFALSRYLKLWKNTYIPHKKNQNLQHLCKIHTPLQLLNMGSQKKRTTKA